MTRLYRKKRVRQRRYRCKILQVQPANLHRSNFQILRLLQLVRCARQGQGTYAA